jgi:predicted DNA-binding ribbon-helix-helix protein
MAVQNLKEIAELQARTIGDLIAELTQEIKTADYREKEAVKRMTEAYAEHQDMKSKLDMWTILKR